MAYTPTNWQDGDVITAEKLNKIEDELDALDDAVAGVVTLAVDNSNIANLTFHKITTS